MRSKKTLQVLGVVLILAAALVLAYLILTYQPGAPRQEGAPGASAENGVAVVSWNLYNFGRSKDDEEMAVIAGVLRDFELVAIQEVSTGPEGPQAVARLADELRRTGAEWDYVVSEPTVGNGPERYAYLWKPSRLRLVGQPWLEASLETTIDREPFMARFEQGGRQVLLASFHAVPRSKNPAAEVRLLDALHHRYEPDNLIVMGDFNLAESSEAFSGLKGLGYAPVLVGQRTSLRMRRRDGQHLANEYDNIFYETRPLQSARAGVVDFTDAFGSLREARTISDHLPVYMEVRWH